MQGDYKTSEVAQVRRGLLSRQQSASRSERALAALYNRVESGGLHEMNSIQRPLEVNPPGSHLRAIRSNMALVSFDPAVAFSGQDQENLWPCLAGSLYC